ncbi:MAG: hypothetical protein JWM81_428 [Candidatus Saccharibacteria bacterium]|nr:hypothetical protein [Candidatus Saccharibacteria bacterium]
MGAASVVSKRLRGYAQSGWAFGLIAVLLVAVVQSHSVSGAQAAQIAGNITVAPAYSVAQVGALQPQTSFSVGVRNNYAASITMTAALSGLSVQNNSLTPSTKADAALVANTVITPAAFTIPAGRSINVAVTIKNSASLSPGGHYVSLLLTQTGTTASSAGQLSLEPAISATIYVIKEDGAVRNLLVTSVSPRRSLLSLPKAVNVTFSNPGNVYSVPRGVITIDNKKAGTIYAQGVINNQSIPLFPAEKIKLQTDLTEYKQPILPGRYSLHVVYRYDGQDTVQSTTVYFWYVPKIGLLAALIVVCFVVWLMHPKRRRIIKIHLQKAPKIAIKKAAKVPTKVQSQNPISGTPKAAKKIAVSGTNSADQAAHVVPVRADSKRQQVK